MHYPWQNPPIWHAMNVHMPVVLALLGLPLVCMVAITRGRSRRLRWGVVAFYAVVTLAAWWAVQTGERARGALPPSISQAASERIDFHEWMAEKLPLLAAATTLLLLASNLPRRWARQTFTTLGLVVSVTIAGWVMVTAHSGGLAVYENGLGTVAMRDGSPDRKIGGSDASASNVNPTSKTPDLAIGATKEMSQQKLVSFSRDIKPLLIAKCAECHADKELKSGFDVSSVGSIVKGGKKAGAGLVAGKPDESAIVQYLEGRKQPRMPKEGKALEPKDIGLIKAWIAGGAVDDSDAKLVSAAPVSAKPTTEPVSADWDPQVQFNADESVAVRRYVRLKNLPPAPQVPKVALPTSNPVDNFIVAKWTEPKEIPLCDDATYVRRVYLDLIGMIPTADEAQKFIEDKENDKRAKLIDGLLDRTKDYAGHWVSFWEDALCSNGLHQGGVGTHGNYRQWIFDNFEKNKPYDTMVQELLDPSMPGHPPRYVLNDNHFRTIQSSADTAQVFLGTAIKCASCHSHFLNDEWPQQRAVAFAGFFAEKDMELVRCERKSGQFVATHFMFDLPSAPTSAPSDPAARMKRVAQLITDPANPRFARTIVNRLWKRYLGLGLFEPADDYREDTPPSHPELLNWLADDFIRHGYDIKHTVKLILTSRTYQLRYDPVVEDHFDVAKPKEPRYFRSPALRRLTEEQLLDSLAVAMSQKLPEKRAYQNDISTPLTRSLGKPAARNEVSTGRPDDTAVVQALELLNGKEYHDQVYQGALIKDLAVQPKLESMVEQMYWSAYSRAPSEKEKEAAASFVKGAPMAASTQPIDVVWLEDSLPPGAKARGNWKFGGGFDQPVFSGKASHTEGEEIAGAIQHLFLGGRFAVSPKDVLFAYVYIDPAKPPKEIVLQWNSGGSWEHRASWGESVIPFTPKTAMGPLPKSGQWVRLEVAAEKVGFTKPGNIVGLSFDQFGGKVYWDKSGASKGPAVFDPETVGDMVWALVTGPEFQYVK